MAEANLEDKFVMNTEQIMMVEEVDMESSCNRRLGGLFKILVFSETKMTLVFGHGTNCISY